MFHKHPLEYDSHSMRLGGQTYNRVLLLYNYALLHVCLVLLPAYFEIDDKRNIRP